MEVEGVHVLHSAGLLEVGRRLSRKRDINNHGMVSEDYKGHKLPRGKYFGRYYVYVGDKRKSKDKIIDRVVAAEYGIGLSEKGPLTKTEARAVLDKIIAQAKISVTSATLPPAPPTFGEYAKQYLELNKPSWEKRTRATVENTVQKHIIGKFGDRPLKELSYHELQTYINDLVETEAGYSLLQKVTYYLRTILDSAVEDDLIQKNPAASGKRRLKFKVSRKKGNYHTAEECKRLLMFAIGRERIILLLLIQLGLRSEEIFALRRDDVQPGKLRIDEAFVDGEIKGTKTDDSEADMPLTPALQMALQEWIDANPGNPGAWLFPASRGGAPFTPANYLKRVLKPLAKGANVPSVTFQSLRRTFATQASKFAKNAKDAQALMRHSNIATTMDIYVQPISDSVRAIQLEWEKELQGTVN